MSKFSVSQEIVKRYSSVFETFFGSFADAVENGDRMGAALASAQIAQAGLSTFELFKTGSETLVITPKEKAQLQAAALDIRNIMDKHLDDLHNMAATNGTN